ncbi:MAG: POTRA domain-containing protein, partial [Gemmatimonadaceae bacterium]
MKLRAVLRAATIALLATAASFALPARSFAQDITCEAGDLEVLGLDFRGNHAIGDDDLALRVTTTPSAWGRRHLRAWFSPKRCLNRIELARDLLRLKAYYRDRGFYLAQVDTVVTPVGTRAVRVAFDITEGDPLRLASYRVSGLEGLADSAEIMSHLRLKVGQPFDILVFGADMDTIIHRLRDVGYYRATTIPGYDWDTSGVARADAFITVVPG